MSDYIKETIFGAPPDTQPPNMAEAAMAEEASVRAVKRDKIWLDSSILGRQESALEHEFREELDAVIAKYQGRIGKDLMAGTLLWHTIRMSNSRK